MPAGALRPDQRLLLAAGGVSAAAWTLEPLRWLIIPFVYLNTHLHEWCHAVAALATGGEVAFIRVFANGSGVAQIAGGNLLVVGSAGYVGAAVLGGVFILCARDPATARRALAAAGIVLGLTLLAWVRGDAVGVASALVWSIALYVFAGRGSDAAVQFGCALLGVSQALTSLQALAELLHLSRIRYGATDAELLARLTGLPPIYWAVLWSALSLVVLIASLRAAWSRRA